MKTQRLKCLIDAAENQLQMPSRLLWHERCITLAAAAIGVLIFFPYALVSMVKPL